MRMPASPRRQIWTYQVAAFVQAVCIAPGAVAVKLFLPFHHVCLAAIFFDEPANAVAAFASVFGAFDAEHVEFSFDVTEDEIGSPRHDGDITTCRGDRRSLMAKKPNVAKFAVASLANYMRAARPIGSGYGEKARRLLRPKLHSARRHVA